MISYRSMVLNEFLKRKRRNPAYSTRSFARDLRLSQPFLTQVLNGKRRLSWEKAELVAERLKLKASQKRLFVCLVRWELTDSPEDKRTLEEELARLLSKHPRFALLSEDTFNIVADWHYFAILELTALCGFKDDPNWISRKLDIPPSAAQGALERLKRVGLLQEKGGAFRKAERDYIFEKAPSVAVRKHHQQTLRLASAALDRQQPDLREYFTISFPMDPGKIGHAKKAIREFSEQLMSDMQETSPKSVYKLAVQLFRLDKEHV